jgi:hypothetical protein
VQVHELSDDVQHRVRLKWADIQRMCNGQLVDDALQDADDQACVQEMLHALSESFPSLHNEPPRVQMKVCNTLEGLNDTTVNALRNGKYYEMPLEGERPISTI